MRPQLRASADRICQQTNIGNRSGRLKEFFNHRYTLWCVLSLPAIVLFWPIATGSNYYGGFLVETGEWSVWLLILTMAITPLSLIFKGKPWVRWLIRRRRYFGVASFAYAAVHVGFYVWDVRSLARILFVAERFYAWPGWLAIAFMLILAASSNTTSQRLLASNWKNLQRLTYIVALLAAMHWVMLARGEATAAWMQIGLLVLLEIIRIGYRARQMLVDKRRRAETT